MRGVPMRRADLRLHARRGTAALLTAACLTPAFASAADSDAAGLERCDTAWTRRAEGHRGARAAAETVRDAIDACEVPLAADPGSLEARYRLLRVLHFGGEFGDAPEATRAGYVDRGRELADAGIAELARRLAPLAAPETLEAPALRDALAEAGIPPEPVARLYFWSAIHWGAWSQRQGLLAAVRHGVANRLRNYARVTLALEPDYDAGGAYRLLGRLHATLPRVPWLSGWVDREQALPLIERAFSIDPAHPGNRLLLALTLLERAPERRALALSLLEGVAAHAPRGEALVEEMRMREEARERLALERDASVP